MHIVITEESHNRVSWQVRTPLLWIEGALLVGALVFALLVLPSPSPVRWQAIAVVDGILLVAGSVVAVTTPLIDQGYLERMPEGGEVQRAKVWPFVGARSVITRDLGEIVDFDLETEIFEDAPRETTQLCRLWAVSDAGERICLTNWAHPASVTALGTALAKAGRRSFQGAEV